LVKQDLTFSRWRPIDAWSNVQPDFGVHRMEQIEPDEFEVHYLWADYWYQLNRPVDALR